MNITELQRISPSNENIRYMGRIDKSNPESYLFIYAASSICFDFYGNTLYIRVRNLRSYFKNYIGFMIDGVMKKIEITDMTEDTDILLLEETEAKKHHVEIWKCQDACHYFRLEGLFIGAKDRLLELPEAPLRRIEVYGDSVSCGEVSEAVWCAGSADPKNEGEYSNSYYSYAWILARKLGASLHDVSQGGIALFDKTGYFCGPDYVGVESTYDKLAYHPYLDKVTKWDFSQYIPHVVIFAFGQNDANPDNYMPKDDPESLKKAEIWKKAYEKLIRELMGKYPNATFILTTTILNHDKAWDEAIEEIKNRIADGRVHHFLYSNNGCGTPGHIRIPEAEKMAGELETFIKDLGENVFKDH